MIMRSRLRCFAAIAIAIFAGSLTAATPDKYLPDDSEVVLTVNVRQFLDTPLINRDLDRLREALKGQEKISAELEKVGLDPLKDIDRITITAAPGQGDDHFFLVAHGRFDTAKLEARAKTAVTEESDNVSEVKEEDHTFYSITQPGAAHVFYIAWPESGTIVASPSKELILHAFGVQAGKSQSSLNQDMAGLLEKIDEKSVASIVGLGSLLKDTPQAGQVQHFNGTVTIDQSMHLAAAVAVKDVETAETLTKTITDGMAQVKTMLSMAAKNREDLAPAISLLEAIKIRREGDTINIEGDLTEDLLDKLHRSGS
jgi:hypothetical protein